MRNITLLFLALILNSALVQAKVFDLHQVGFVPTPLKKENQIEVISNTTKDNKIFVDHLSCYLKDAKGVLTQRSLNYVNYVRPLNEGEKLEMKVNGVHVVAKKNNPVRFMMAGNCEKLYPVSFVSPIDQDYMGVKIKKGSVVYGSSMHENAMWGPIGDDGYYTWKDFDGTANRSKITEINTCIKVLESADSKKGFNIYKGRRIPLDKSEPIFWKAKSKYVGNRICSSQPEAIIDCSGTGLLEWEEQVVFGLESKSTFINMGGGDPKEYDELLRQGVIDGERCDAAVAAYEKKTGKKVPVSSIYQKMMDIEKRRKSN